VKARHGVGKRRGIRFSGKEHGIVRRVPAVLWERDGQTGRFTFVSEEASRILGVPAKDWTERETFWRDHVHPDDHAEAERSFHADVQRGCGYSIEYRMLAADGHVVWVRDVMSVVFAHGRPARAYGVLVDVTARKILEAEQVQLQIRLRRENAALLDIAEKETLHLGDLEAALRLITEAAARAMEVRRASFWTFDDAHMSCRDLYERPDVEARHGRHSSGVVLAAATYPRYFAGLSAGRAIAAADARQDPRTSELVAYLDRHGIRAMLDAPVRVGGRVAGVLCLEHVGEPRAWMPDEEQFAGTLADLIALAMEARKRKMAETALKRSEAQTRAVLGASPDAIVMVDADRRVVEFNRAAEAMFGHTRAEVLGRDIVDTLVPPRLREGMLAMGARLRASDAFSSEAFGELVGLRADGTEFPLEVRVFTLPDSEGALTGGFLRDMTGQVSGPGEPTQTVHLETDLEALIEARTRDVRAAMMEMEAFSYTVSHDLRAPIRAIDAFAQLLSDECGDQLGERGERYLQRIRAAARRLSILVNDFILLARVASTELTRVPVDLSALSRVIVDELRQASPDRVVTFQIAERLLARGDPGLLRILLENLIGNAWKFTSHHPTASITLGAAEVGGEVVYTLQDDGAGFDPAYADRLFRPFSRLHGSGEFDGTGIGLAIARKIVERHGGRIWAQGAVEAGASFQFTLGAAAEE
jgi:PAS domain S-box-containing protein